MESVLFNKLLTQILNGQYKKGEKLPSENSIAGKYNISRITVRKVYQILEKTGHIISKQGKGWFVRENRIIMDLNLYGRKSFSNKVLERGFDLKTSIIQYGFIPYDKTIYQQIGSKKNEKVFFLEQLREINNKPSALHVSYLKLSDFPDIAERAKNIKSIFEYFEEQKVQIQYDQAVLSITYPTLQLRELFHCPELVPIMFLEAKGFCVKTDKVIQLFKSYYRGDVFKFVVKP
jgi:GntR family transcriptional regulator